jgi:hypothetical protein
MYFIFSARNWEVEPNMSSRPFRKYIVRMDFRDMVPIRCRFLFPDFGSFFELRQLIGYISRKSIANRFPEYPIYIV